MAEDHHNQNTACEVRANIYMHLTQLEAFSQERAVGFSAALAQPTQAARYKLHGDWRDEGLCIMAHMVPCTDVEPIFCR